MGRRASQSPWGLLFWRWVCVRAFVTWACCPQANKPRLSQMHARVCKLKFNFDIRHRKLFLNLSDRHMVHSKHQLLVFILLLQLNSCGHDLKVARARGANLWTFQSHELYHLTRPHAKWVQGKSRHVNTGILAVLNTDLGMIAIQLWLPTGSLSPLADIPPLSSSPFSECLPAKSYLPLPALSTGGA